MVNTDGTQTIASGGEVSTCESNCPCKQTTAAEVGEGSYVDSSASYTFTYPFTGGSASSQTWTTIPIVPTQVDYDQRARKILLGIAQDEEESTEDRIDAASRLLIYPE